ncbi:hypothetical protein BESB_036220 [Besnoitia besnoiti]|uniref:Uncharacterized protein n=1 Tax=Besnoitia besnoiti TaxID=94643 RepID=A0A2A9MIZ0_BESBE|nr:hypothetical protein BESB_036220 [Besnoitia besnoiti]PFH37164.1 hypothetical protein BESB_036220 [Besnoitia besnoiti]
MRWIFAVFAISSFLTAGANGEAADSLTPGASVDAHTTSLSYMYKYKKASATLVQMWRQYTALESAVRHLLRDYNVVVKQQKYREMVQRVASSQQSTENMITGKKKGGLNRRSIKAEVTSLKELKEQLAAESQRLEHLPTKDEPEKLLEHIELDETPLQLSRALRTENAELLRKSLKQCSKTVDKLLKKQKNLTTFIKGLKSRLNSKVHELFITQSAATGNVFDSDAPLTIHIPIGSHM